MARLSSTKLLGLALAGLAAVALFGAPVAAAAAPKDDVAPVRVEPWPARVLELAATLPVLEEGRVKPLSTFAAFRLLQLHGRRTLEVPNPDDPEHPTKLTPTEWILDSLFFPEQVRSYPLFLVEDLDALRAVGLDTLQKRKRDQWTYDELFGVADKLIDLGRKWSELEETDRTPVMGHVIRTAQNFITLHEFLSRWEGLHMFPPRPDERTWLTASEVSEQVASGRGEGLDVSRAALEQIATLFDVRTDLTEGGAFEKEFESWHGSLVAEAERRGEYGKIGLEVAYYDADFFTRAQVLFVLFFLLSMATLLRPSSKLLYRIAKWGTLLPLGVLTAGIVVRCILRGRPPVSTLYETILFITSVAVLAAWITEALNRQRVALILGTLLGAVGMFFAAWYEEISKVDTMPQLEAVLDTNFWLSTHVTTVSMGYAAGMLAAAIAHVYVFGKLAVLLGFVRENKTFFRNVGRAVYGTVCFGLIFSTVGTILGGIWANDSWGRFWGWDPKENGALMIVLMNLVILHARLGGYVRDWGVSLLSIVLGTVVAFSWFHVNLLQVGLHSYGFDERLHSLVWGYYTVEWSVLGLGVFTYLALRPRGGGGGGAPASA